MKLLKSSLLLLALSVMVMLVVLLFAKKEYSFQKEMRIRSSSSDVYNCLKFLKNQEKYNEWLSQDETTDKQYVGEDGTEQAQFKWKSNSSYLRSGTQTLTNLVYPERIESEFVVDSPYNIVSNQYFLIKEEKDATVLTWKLNIHFPFPYNIVILSDDFESVLISSMDKSLLNVRKALEK